MNNYSWLICFFLAMSPSFFAQENASWIQQRIEYWMEKNQTENIDFTVQIDTWEYYRAHPLNLNTATKEEVRSLELLSDVQVEALFAHRTEMGKLLTIYELQVVPYWDDEVIQMVLPFVTVDDNLNAFQFSLKNALKYGTSEWITRYQRAIDLPVGYQKVTDSMKLNSSNYFWGSPDHYYTRYRFRYGPNLSVGFTADKDAGEQFFKGDNKKGFDYYSAHLYYQGGKYLKSFALGDYHIQLGQGLNCWTSYAFSKTADIATIKKNPTGIKPHTSTDESRFLRGAAVTLGYKRLQWLTFFSHKNKDGRLSDDTNSVVLNSISDAGYHRTTSEINLRNAMTETILGSSLNYTVSSFRWGLNAVKTLFSAEYNKEYKPYNTFDFRGKSMTSVSTDYSYSWKNALFFGELSWVDFSRKWAYLQGMTIALDPSFSMSLLYRNYDKAYQTIYNTGFSEGNNVQNEQGTYIGFTTKPFSKWTLQAYVDFFQFPWLKYQVSQPSKGNERLVQVTYKPNKKIEVYARYRMLNKEMNSSLETAIYQVENVQQQNVRFNAAFQVSEGISLRSRIEFVEVKRASEHTQQGTLITQDVIYKSKKTPLDITLRYALFQTDSWATRIYSYEANPLYMFSSAAYYNNGNRMYVLVHYNVTRNIDCWLRYGEFYYQNQTSFGSGAQTIEGNVKREIAIQLRVKMR